MPAGWPDDLTPPANACGRKVMNLTLKTPRDPLPPRPLEPSRIRYRAVWGRVRPGFSNWESTPFRSASRGWRSLLMASRQ